MHFPIHGKPFTYAVTRAPLAVRGRLKWQGAYPDTDATLLRWVPGIRIVPHKRLWRLTAADGAELACELETLTSHRVLLVVKRGGDPIVTETFADKRDALARSVGLYKEMKDAGGGDQGAVGTSEAPDS